ncbi:MAG: SAM-dependent methyltransferase, partial [Deltaproteobacteria bacterium]|nr:SAM-dependent methyltransferase [Deltaproteobacteria bacterium]
GSFSVILSNPPYVKTLKGRISPREERAIARSEQKGTLKDLVNISRYMVRPGGRVIYVYPGHRLKEVTSVMTEEGLALKRLCFVYPKSWMGRERALIEVVA